ncbi:hypothetical protein AN959_18415 [Psychrobacillus sp. FJAT-21963]|nr:hypothetical protein AN959_18415 [Psychrobacillus sp. FJAT-21963]
MNKEKHRFYGVSDCRQTQRNLKLSTVFFYLQYIVRNRRFPFQALRFPRALPQPSPLLLRKLVAEKTLLLRKLVAKINFATLSPGASARAVPVGVFAPSTPID